MAGNTSEVQLNIANIDSQIDGLKLATDAISVTNKKSTISILSNEPIKNISDESQKAKAASYSMRRAAPAINNALELELEYQCQGAVAVTDDAGNIELLAVDANYIDKDAPEIINREETLNDDGSITIKLTLNEPINYINNLSGWSISEDSTTLTKVFNANGIEQIDLIDLAGNKTNYELEVREVKKIPYDIDITEIEGTDLCICTITADRPLQKVEGWELLEDGKTIAKVINMNNYEEKLEIRDENGNSSTVYVGIEKDKEADIGNNDGEEVNDDNQNNKTPEQEKFEGLLPQTGTTIFIEALIATLIAIIVISYTKYRKNKRIK